ncbi:MAG: S8 family serine peptidase [Candidatus Thorarchaeota archaeon]
MNKLNVFLFFIIIILGSTSALSTNTYWETDIISFNKVSSLTEGDGNNVIVAVIDGGIIPGHKEFAPNFLWTNPHEIPGNNIDDDHNGYVDDIHGWNFVDNNSKTQPVPTGLDSNNNGIKDEYLDHATFITGILIAKGLDMYRGLVPNIKIIDLRVFDTDGNDGGFDRIRSALKYIISLKTNGVPVKVINYSLTNEFAQDNETTQLISDLYNLGVLMVASSGNDRSSSRNFVGYPASLPDVIGVGAVDSQMQLADFSRYGANLSLVAPGKNVYSTVHDNDYFTESGTSFSSPFVTGAIAFLYSLRPNLTINQMKSILLNSTTDLGTPGKDIYYGYGLLNVTNMLIEAGVNIYAPTNAPWPLYASSIAFILLIVIEKKSKFKKL